MRDILHTHTHTHKIYRISQNSESAFQLYEKYINKLIKDINFNIIILSFRFFFLDTIDNKSNRHYA